MCEFWCCIDLATKIAGSDPDDPRSCNEYWTVIKRYNLVPVKWH